MMRSVVVVAATVVVAAIAKIEEWRERGFVESRARRGSHRHRTRRRG